MHDKYALNLFFKYNLDFYVKKINININDVIRMTNAYKRRFKHYINRENELFSLLSNRFFQKRWPKPDFNRRVNSFHPVLTSGD